VALTGTKTFQNYIAGEWSDSASGETFESFNPANGDAIGTDPTNAGFGEPLKKSGLSCP